MSNPKSLADRLLSLGAMAIHIKHQTDLAPVIKASAECVRAAEYALDQLTKALENVEET